MAASRADERLSERGGARLKRRGILAAAGAVVAGIAAKQMALPVSAVNVTGGTTGNPLVIGATSGVGSSTNNAGGQATTLAAAAGGTGFATGGALFILDATAVGGAVHGLKATGAGVLGGNVGNGVVGTGGSGAVSGDPGGYGVVGTAGSPGPAGLRRSGVLGLQSSSDTDTGGPAAVKGVSNGTRGVFGLNIGFGIGVQGATEGLLPGVNIAGGVHGIAKTTGVQGEIDPSSTVAGSVAVKGINKGTGANPVGVQGMATGASGSGVFGATDTTAVPAASPGGTGVQGASSTGIGVYGTTAAGQFGVLGQSLVDNAFGLTGIVNGSNCAAFAGAALNPSSFAASFQGHVQVFDSAFDVFPMGNKHGLAQHPDGSYRTFYSVESPECWVEDFGTGHLAGGKADVALDKDFLALVHADEYHVFLTEHGGHNGLYTTKKDAGGFAVAASPHIAKAAGIGLDQVQGTFSWRVVARPKTSAKVERLAKAALAPKIDFTRIPKKP